MLTVKEHLERATATDASTHTTTLRGSACWCCR